MKTLPLILSALLLSACSTPGTDQHVDNIIDVDLGDNKQDAIASMGEKPFHRVTFGGHKEVLQFCKTGVGAAKFDVYALVWLTDGHVTHISTTRLPRSKDCAQTPIKVQFQTPLRRPVVGPSNPIVIDTTRTTN